MGSMVGLEEEVAGDIRGKWRPQLLQSWTSCDLAWVLAEEVTIPLTVLLALEEELEEQLGVIAKPVAVEARLEVEGGKRDQVASNLLVLNTDMRASYWGVVYRAQLRTQSKLPTAV